jgi:uncharacterized protein YxjI
MTSSDRTTETANSRRASAGARSGTGEAPHRYLVKEARVAVGHDYVIERHHGGLAYKVDGTLLRIPEALTLNDPEGHEVLEIHGTFLDVTDVMHVSRHDHTLATIRKRSSDDLHVEYAAELPKHAPVHVSGKPEDRAYRLIQEGRTIATTSKAWVPLGKGYRADIEASQDDALVLAITVCLDVMSRPVVK